MSWDLIVFAEGCSQYADENGEMAFPDDWEPPVIGSVDEVRAKIDSVFLGVDWSKPNWGNLDTPSYSMQFAVREEPQTFTIFAHGDATAAAVALLKATGWCAYDTGTGKWFDMTAPDEGRRAHQAYLDHIVSLPGDT